MDIHYELLKAHLKTELLNMVLALQDDPNFSREDAANELLKLITYDI